jgi:hypothetical protein
LRVPGARRKAERLKYDYQDRAGASERDTSPTRQKCVVTRQKCVVTRQECAAARPITS